MAEMTNITGFFGSFTKIGLLIFILVYIVFSYFVSRQVDLMIKTLEVGLEGLIKKIALFHLLFSIGLFFLALIIL